MSLPNPFFCPPLPWYSSCLLQLSFHFSFTHQQLNPDSDSSHINFLLSILQHPTTPPPHPIQIGTQVAMATISGSADVRNSSKDSHAGIGSGDMQRCWASRNKMAAPPQPQFSFLFLLFLLTTCETLSLSLNKSVECTCDPPPPTSLFLFWNVWYGWCGIFSVWLVWGKGITELSCLSPSEIGCLSEEFRNLSGYLSAFTSVCPFVFECVRTLVFSGWH